MNRPNRLRDEIENLWIGWVHNPAVDLWNSFADYHNARTEPQSRIDLQEDDDGMTATVDGKTYPIRELWFEKDFGAVLKKTTKSKTSKRKK